MRSTPIAYILWFLCFIALFGIHRIYAGKWITGLIWLFTGGLLLVGQIVDLFLIPGMIESKNRNAKLDTLLERDGARAA